MPTNDERREVAARLRENEYGLEHFTLMEILDFDKDAEPYFDGYHRRPEHLAEDMRMRLADLIEPATERTCRIVWHSNEFGLFDLHCSECCSLLLIQRDGSETQPNYCPNCGRRVRSNNE